MDNMSRVVANILLILGLTITGTAVVAATTASSSAQFSIDTKDLVYGMIGVLIAVLGAWSKRQDRDIAEAKANANKALAEAYKVRLELVQAKAEFYAKSHRA